MMILLIECIVLCLLFTLAVLPAQYKAPLNMIASYPPAIRKRVEQLPQYQGMIKQKKKAHITKKLVGLVLIVLVFTAVAYFSGRRDFISAFVHVLVMFLSVNLFDLVVLDWGIFCHSRRLRIPGTEDMDKEYKDKLFHLKGAAVGCGLGVIVALLAGLIVHIAA